MSQNPLPNTPKEALAEMASIFYVNVECSRAEHIVGMVEAAISNQDNNCTDQRPCTPCFSDQGKCTGPN